MDNVNQSNVNEMTQDTLTIVIYMAIALYISFSLFVIILSRAESVRLRSKLGKTEAEKLENDKQYIAAIKELTETNKSLKWSSDFNYRESERLKTALDDLNKINQSLVKSNDAALNEFENFVQLYADRNGVELEKSEVKRSVTSLKDKECIRIGDGDWDKLAPLFEDAGIVWWKGQKASEIIPEIGGCVSVNYYGKNELTKDTESMHINKGFTVLTASDFIEENIQVSEENIQVSEEIQNEPAIDWSVPQAFPEGYEMKKGTQVMAIESVFNVPIGTKGVVMENNWLSYIDWEGGKYRSIDVSAIKINGGFPYRSEQLAPLNPTDHPNHPDHEKRN